MKKCFGIISWLPSDSRRDKRKNRVFSLISKLNQLWPDTDIIIIKQNWGEIKLPDVSNNIIEYDYTNGLGILKARQVLREKFLALDYDYLITMDDDCLIDCKSGQEKVFLDDIDRHPNGFAFITGHNDSLNKCYAGAQFNLACLSRYILEHEPIPQTDPQKGQAYEDCIYSCLLHNKYKNNEFNLTSTIKHTQWQNSKEPVPTTWQASGEPCGVGNIGKNTAELYKYIEENKDLPNLEVFYATGAMVAKHIGMDNWYVKKLLENKKAKEQAKTASYLYF